MSKEFTQPAFPVPGLQHDEDFNGMSLRDYFAAKAMQGMCANGDWVERMSARMSTSATHAVSFAAYEVADAMLTARSK